LPQIARILVRAAEEKPKPNGDRLREYRDSGLPSLEQQLFSHGAGVQESRNRSSSGFSG
jgi:hypothetical protein